MLTASRLLRYAKDLLGAATPAEILTRTTREVLVTSAAVRCFGVLHPGGRWDDALVTLLDGDAREVSPAERSALFAVFRRLVGTRSSVSLPRDDASQVVYHALATGLGPPTVLHAIPIPHRTGRVQGAVVMALDESRLEPALAELLHEVAALCSSALDNAHRLSIARRDQERLLLLAETADEALWDWNLPKNEVWWGGGIEPLFGGGGVLITNRPTWRIERIHPDDMQRVTASLESALHGNVSSWTAEYRFKRADGRWIHVRDRAWFLRETDGRAYRVIGMLRDVTSLKEALEREQGARAEAERASAVKDEFLAMLGHELRNPLAPIVAALKLVEHRGSQGLTPRQVQVIERQTHHLVRLVDDLLDISRITRGKIELDRRPVALEEVVNRAIEQVGPLIDQGRHKLHLDIDELTLDADPARVGQVLANLVGNAAKYTEPGGNISVTARRDGDKAYIEVKDDGIGMSPELLAGAFDTFVQGRQSLDRAQGGLGLGLSLVRSMVTLHGGTVSAHSDGLGLGTTLKVRLPLARPGDSARPSPPQSVKPAPASQSVEVLLVDDNEDAAEMVAELLRGAGHRVHVAHHAEAALALLEKATADVGVLDIGLPGMSGYELAGRVKQKWPGMRLIALTGYGQSSDRERALEAGFDAHLVKPIAVEKLEELIARFAEERARPARAPAEVP
ncbi:MAG: response regulator [Archangiaceae bacterium]|nr:response regulator [Archangiaceae bacterium]